MYCFHGVIGDIGERARFRFDDDSGEYIVRLCLAMLCSSSFRLMPVRLDLYSQAQGGENWMAKFVVCELVLVFFILTIFK